MCGIVGYIGDKQAAPILLDGLSKLEYRGYDSSGLAVNDGEKINIVKAKGRLKILSDMTEGGESVKGTIGIGHTRWATHGAPSDTNSHPHFNEKETITVVHNGIIENYQQLKHKLEEKGYHFKTETDTEVVVQLLDYYYHGNPLEAISKIMSRIEGSYALGILFADTPDIFYAVRKDSPLIVGVNDSESFIASDVPAILKYTRKVYYMENGEIATLDRKGVTFYNRDLDVVKKELKQVEWDIDAAEKGGYQHFMIKEIFEQPKAVVDTINPRIHDNKVDIEELGLSAQEIKDINKIYIIACGTAYYASIVGKYVIEEFARIPVEVDMASEFRYRNPIIEEKSMAIIISQSGETADSLAALREAKKRGAKVLGIVNAVGSSIAREADNVMYTWAGPEIAVASTKAYSTQLVALYLLAILFGREKGNVDINKETELIAELRELPKKIQTILDTKIEEIQYFASKYVAAKDVFFIGRGVDYAASLEGALKLKEVSYVHSEAYAAGELKHGPIALLEEGSMVTAILTQENLYQKMVSNVQEVQARHAKVLIITNEGNENAKNCCDMITFLPKTNECFTTSLSVVVLQLLSYYVSVGKGLDVDKPRNLAKSVTVE